MKKWILLSGFISLSLISVAKAAVPTPLDQQGHTVPVIDWVGAIPCSIDVSTGVNAVLCGSAGRGIVYGVIASSIAATDFLVFRDSTSANLTSSTLTVVFANGTGANATGNSTTQLIKFPVPIKFSNGISVNDFTAPAGNTQRWTILYRPMTATE